MASGPAKPIVIIPCDHRMVGEHPFHMVGEKYVLGVVDGAGGVPLLLPVLAEPIDVDLVLTLADGLFFTGSPSNVAPHLYGGPAPRNPHLLDERRDRTTLRLIREALARGVPLLAVCRGFQELNVALGGTLHQHVEEVPGRRDHRAAAGAPLDVQYGPAHEVTVTPGGRLEALTGARRFTVNSLHSQGIDGLAPGLEVEATAPDGTVEAVWVKQAQAFALAVQWHPEWKLSENPVSRAIFAAFGDAIRDRQKAKESGTKS